MPGARCIHLFDKPPKRPYLSEYYYPMLKHIGFVRARFKQRVVIAKPQDKDIPARSIVPPPGVLVPTFHFDEKTKLLGYSTRPWEDILVEELEEKMRPKAKPPYDWGDIFKREFIGTLMDFTPPYYQHYAMKDAQATRKLFDGLRHTVRNMPSPRLQGHKAHTVVLDSMNVDFSEIELRIAAQLLEEKNDQPLIATIRKNRNQEGTCRPTTSEPSLPSPAIFPPSPRVSYVSGRKDSVIPRLLADSVSRSPRSTSG